MFMTKLRRATKKYRWVLIIIVIALAIGLIGSFATWNSGGGAHGNNNSAEASTLDQIEQIEAYLEQQLPADGEALDYSKANSLADLHMTLANLYNTAYQENSATDANAALTYYATAVDYATKAADYYQTALAEAPESLNDLGKARLYASQANALMTAGDSETAQPLYEQAIALGADDYDINISYSQFLYYTQGLEAMETFLRGYIAKLPAEDERISNAESYLSYVQMIDQLFQSVPEEENGEGEDGAEDPTPEDGQGDAQ